MMHRLGLTIAAALAAATTASVAAQPRPSELAAAAPVGDAEARTTLQVFARLLADTYVFPEVGRRYAAALQSGLAAGRYRGQLRPEEFAARVTADVQAVAPDGHLRLSPVAPSTTPRAAAAPESSIESGRWLANGVAYLKINNFLGSATPAELDRFMAEHASARVLIFDARTHRGGGIGPIDAMLPYLFAKPARLVWMDTRAAAAASMPFLASPSLHKLAAPATIDRREHRVVPHPTEQRLFDAKVFYLTSKRTASAGEHLALAFKLTGRATLVGETTRGAGHFGSLPAVGDRFTAFVPIGRTYDPKTGRGWEGTGVAPDVAVAADQALARALQLAAAS
jgi:hypothetical protein